MKGERDQALWGTPFAFARMISHGQATIEARRCLRCYDAPCTQACPVHIDVPGFITRLAEGNMAGSRQLLIEPNPLAATCGLVCPTMNLCEGACVLPRMGQSPIRIGALQFFVAASARSREAPAAVQAPGNIAVIGGGPSGLSCAVALRREGHRVSLFESTGSLGGLMQQAVPPHRLPAWVVSEDLGRMESLGIDVHLNSHIDETAAKEMQEQYDAVYVAIGMGKTRRLAVPGSDLVGVRPAMDFLCQVRASEQGHAAAPDMPASVLVLGGGNVALDAAIVASRRGAERVIVLYRRSIEEMPGWRSEYMEATGLGVEFRWLTTVSRVLGQDGRVRAVEVQPMRFDGVQDDGRRGVIADAEAPRYVVACDLLLLALGQDLDMSVAKSFPLSVTRGGMIAVQPGKARTSLAKVFAGGDAVSGSGTIVHAVAQGMAAAREIDDWLGESRRPQ
jgi:dihydropyrimidine dehydrogenase (NAD+) subunit PreT